VGPTRFRRVGALPGNHLGHPVRPSGNIGAFALDYFRSRYYGLPYPADSSNPRDPRLSRRARWRTWARFTLIGETALLVETEAGPHLPQRAARARVAETWWAHGDLPTCGFGGTS